MIELIFKRALEVYRQALEAMDEYADTERLHKDMIEVFCLCKKEDDPEYANVMVRLAKRYEDTGRLTGAEQLYKQAIEWHRRRGSKGDGGKEDYDFTAMVRLAGQYEAMGQHAGEWQPLFRQIYEVYSLGKKGGPAYAETMVRLAGVYVAMGRLAEAEPLFRQAICVYRNAEQSDYDRELWLRYEASYRLYEYIKTEYDMNNFKQEPPRKLILDLTLRLLGGDHIIYKFLLKKFGLDPVEPSPGITSAGEAETES